MEDLSIRQANKDDLPAILSIYSQPSVDNGRVLPLDRAEEILSRFDQYPNYKLYVTMLGDQVVGTFALLIMDNLVHLGMPSGVIEDVAVDSRLQGKGIGKSMMQFAIEKCRELGCYKVALSSNLMREDAHTFYEMCSFKKHGYSFLIEF